MSDLANPPQGHTPALHELAQYVKSTKAGIQFQSNPPGVTFFYHSSTADPALAVGKSSSEPGSGTVAPQHAVEERGISRPRRIMLSIALTATAFVYGMNATMIGNAQIFITEHFDEPAKLGWIGVSFALGSAVAILPVGKASRFLDTKWFCIGCLVGYVAASALCGGAPSMDAVVIGRAFGGAAGAGLAVTNAQLFARFAMRADHAWYGFTTTSIFGAGCIVGPVVSGALCESSRTWRWVFHIQTIVLGAMIPAYLLLLPSTPAGKKNGIPATLQSIDILGTLFLSGGLVSFALAITSGGSLYAWNSGRTIAAMALFVFCTAVFFVIQRATEPSKRLLPTSLLRNPQITLLFVTAASASAALLISIYYIPVHFLYVFGDDANIGALRVIPFVSFWWWLLVVCSAVLPRLGYHGVWYAFSGLCLIAGGATMYTVRVDTTPQAIAGFMVLYILGLLTSEAHGLIGPSIIERRLAEEAVTTGLGELEKECSTDLFSFAQALGGMIGLAVASAVFQNGAYADLARALNGRGLSEEQLRSAIIGVRSALWRTQVNDTLKRAWLDGLVRNVDRVWMLVVVAGGIYTVCAYGMSRKRFVAPR